MDTSSIYAATVEAHCLRCNCKAALVRRPRFDERRALPNGSLHKAWIVSPPSNRAAAFEGASFFTVSGPAKKVVNASVIFSTYSLSLSLSLLRPVDSSGPTDDREGPTGLSKPPMSPRGFLNPSHESLRFSQRAIKTIQKSLQQ